jgi:hypothetical protein
MEHLHTLINGIDNLKEHMTDNEYLNLMTAISKLNEIISSYDDVSNNDTESYYDEEEEEEYEEEEIEVIDVDLLLETIKNNEIIFNNFIIQKKLSDDLRDNFILSKFNVINQTSYNYITNKTCNCKDEFETCNDINNLYNCRNYQNLILQFPIVHLIVKRNCPCCNDKIIEEINKYNLFEIDGKIKSNNIEINIFKKKISLLLNMMQKIHENKYQVILFICIYDYIFNYKDFINYNNLRESMLNKLKTEGIKDSANEYVPYWSNIFNFDKNIINIMINSLESLK